MIPQLILSPPHDCPYLAGRQARLAIYHGALSPARYADLSARGFRRSGSEVYRPQCTGCRACVPLRIPVATFSPDRAQRRNWRRNAGLTVQPVPARFVPEHYRLFCRYLDARHRGGGMDSMAPAAYLSYLDSGWCDTGLYEFRAGNELLAVAVVDRFRSGWSAVYTFYEPAEAHRGLGTYVILWQIDAVRRAGLHWLYVGYWIGGAAKMDYKNRFRPFETLTESGWQGRS